MTSISISTDVGIDASPKSKFSEQWYGKQMNAQMAQIAIKARAIMIIHVGVSSLSFPSLFEIQEFQEFVLFVSIMFCMYV